MVKISTVAALIDLWPSAEAFGGDIGLKWPGHARVMKMRGRIPDDYWPRIVAAAEMRGLPVSEELLRRLHQRQPDMVAS
jgi:hypothetical protein